MARGAPFQFNNFISYLANNMMFVLRRCGINIVYDHVYALGLSARYKENNAFIKANQLSLN